MTRKELHAVQESYRITARECLRSEATYTLIIGICQDIANEMCYNHHERGQRLWAFFQALEQEMERGC